MFESARFKLTSYYLIIIMIISLIFSLVIYTTISRELERGFRRAELRFRADQMDLPVRQRPRPLEDISPQLVEDLVKTAKKNLVINLVLINGVILSFSAIAGYFLAGKTLIPIETALEEQKRFVADASHELRTPLTALKTSIEVALRDKKLSAGQAKKVIKSSLQDVESLQALTSNLLNLASLQNNHQNLSFNQVNIAKVINNAWQKLLPLAKKKKISFKTKINSQKLLADQQSLEKLFLILLDNAVKYSPSKGKIMVKTGTAKNNLIIKITDTGIGIDDKDIPLIFNRFYRVDKARSKDGADGFGLGLSLAKEIIKLHKGSIQVSSVLNQGTTFTIKLPIK